MDGQDCVWEAKRYKIGHTRLESHYVIKSDLSRHIPLKKKRVINLSTLPAICCFNTVSSQKVCVPD